MASITQYLLATIIYTDIRGKKKKRMQFAHCHKLILCKMHDVHKLKGLIIGSWLIHGTLGISLDPLRAADRGR